jgi:hypothetical protein
MSNSFSGSGSIAGAGSLSIIASGPVVYSVGDTGPGGGTIYYDAESQQSWGRWLEYAPNGWFGGNSDPVMPFGAVDYNNIINTSMEIGYGSLNTSAMVEKDPDTSRAGGATTSYSSNTKSDWFLPSTNELIALYNYVNNNNISGFTRATFDENYWSSFDITGGHARSVNFGTNTAFAGLNNGFQPNAVGCSVRPIRYVSE